MKINLINKFTLSVFFICFSLIYANQKIDHTYPEISDDDFLNFQNKYIIEESESEKKYLEPVIKPEKFDLNKDRKISKEEIKQALIYVFYPKDKKTVKKLPEYFDQHVKNNIDVFVKNIKINFMNYKQFSYMMTGISLTNFFNYDSISSKQKADKGKFNEGESEL